MIGIYGIYNNNSNKWYIGQSVNITARWGEHKYDPKNNIHKNSHLQRSWNIHGEKSFNFVILERHVFCDKKRLTEREQFWTNFVGYPNSNKCFNLKDADIHGRLSEETKKKIGLSQMGRPGTMLGRNHSDSARKKMSEKRKGVRFSDEHKKKISESNKGKLKGVRSKEQREKLSIARKGRKFSDEHKKHISDALKGRTYSEETLIKMSIAQKARFSNGNKPKGMFEKGLKSWNKGKKHSEESRIKMSIAQKKRFLFICPECGNESLIQKEKE